MLLPLLIKLLFAAQVASVCLHFRLFVRLRFLGLFLLRTRLSTKFWAFHSIIVGEGLN